MRLSRIGGIVAASAATALIAAGTALAQPEPGQFRPGKAWHAALQRLDLSTDQQQRIKGLAETARPRLTALREQHTANRATVKALMEATTPDPTAIGNAMLKTRNDRGALRTEAKRLRDDTLALLTPEQRARLEGMREGLREGMKIRRGRPGFG